MKARSVVIIGTSGGIFTPNFLASYAVQRGVGISIARTPHKVFRLCLRDPSLTKRGQGRLLEIPLDPPFLEGGTNPPAPPFYKGGSWYGATLYDDPSLTKRGQGRSYNHALLPWPFDPAQDRRVPNG